MITIREKSRLQETKSPQRRTEPTTLHQAGQRAQHTTNEVFRPPDNATILSRTPNIPPHPQPQKLTCHEPYGVKARTIQLEINRPSFFCGIFLFVCLFSFLFVFCFCFLFVVGVLFVFCFLFCFVLFWFVFFFGGGGLCVWFFVCLFVCCFVFCCCFLLLFFLISKDLTSEKTQTEVVGVTSQDHLAKPRLSHREQFKQGDEEADRGNDGKTTSTSGLALNGINYCGKPRSWLKKSPAVPQRSARLRDR